MCRNQARLSRPLQPGDDQRGSALVISLIMLLVVSLLAIGGLRSTILQERMSANLHDRELAFQAAEAALRAGERFLASNPPDTFPNANGLYTNGNPNRPNWLAATAGDAATNAISFETDNDAMQGVAVQPQYYIELLEIVPPGTETESGVPESSVGFYRVTARGFGGTADSVVVVSSVFRNQ